MLPGSKLGWATCSTCICMSEEPLHSSYMSEKNGHPAFTSVRGDPKGPQVMLGLPQGQVTPHKEELVEHFKTGHALRTNDSPRR